VWLCRRGELVYVERVLESAACRDAAVVGWVGSCRASVCAVWPARPPYCCALCTS
jgi:hypothetical protein